MESFISKKTVVVTDKQISQIPILQNIPAYAG
jgi:hypothetical protein